MVLIVVIPLYRKGTPNVIDTTDLIYIDKQPNIFFMYLVTRDTHLITHSWKYFIK